LLIYYTMAKHKAVCTFLCLAFLIYRIGAVEFNPFEFLAKLPKVSLVVESKAEASNYDACTSSSECCFPCTIYRHLRLSPGEPISSFEEQRGSCGSMLLK
jgi:hypothetical protein